MSRIPLKISKNTALLAAAVTLGLLCFIGAQYYLRSYLSQAEAKLNGGYKSRQVIVASVDIPAGATLSSDNLATRSIPERYLASTVVGPDAFDTVAGQKIMVALKPGDPIDRGALERGERAALSTTIAVGERAITFPVDEISSISGMLVPGDIIDLIFTGQGTTANSYVPPAEGADKLAAGPKELLHVRPILQAVSVMATGKTTQKRVVRTEGGGQQEVNMDFTTVTLTVNAEQAEQVLLAQKLGQLTAVLRNPDDKAAFNAKVLDEVTFKQVDSPPKAMAAAAGPAGPRNYVEMIIGGNGVAGGERSRTEAEADGMASMVGKALKAAFQPSHSAPDPAPAPSAQDVKSRLGLAAPAPPASRTTSATPATTNIH